MASKDDEHKYKRKSFQIQGKQRYLRGTFPPSAILILENWRNCVRDQHDPVVGVVLRKLRRKAAPLTFDEFKSWILQYNGNIPTSFHPPTWYEHEQGFVEVHNCDGAQLVFGQKIVKVHEITGENGIIRKIFEAGSIPPGEYDGFKVVLQTSSFSEMSLDSIPMEDLQSLVIPNKTEDTFHAFRRFMLGKREATEQEISDFASKISSQYDKNNILLSVVDLMSPRYRVWQNVDSLKAFGTWTPQNYKFVGDFFAEWAPKFMQPQQLSGQEYSIRRQDDGRLFDMVQIFMLPQENSKLAIFACGSKLLYSRVPLANMEELENI